MKRSPLPLVSYSSSEDEEPVQISANKKRKLPSLASTVIVPTPVDNPALHQGRVRSTPHVEGQYAAYIYVPIVLMPKSPLYSVINQVFSFTKGVVPSIHAIGMHGYEGDNGEHVKNTGDCNKRELHVSLSRPIFLRAHQRDDFKRCIKQIARCNVPFKGSFATFAELTNDERTRTFLTLEVGAGHHEMRKMSDALGPALRSIRQKEFYRDPRFHASIAWALLEANLPSSISPTCGASEPVTVSSAPFGDYTTPTSTESGSSSRSASQSSSADQFVRIPRFPSDLVPSLNETFGARLASAKIGSFDVESIVVKIGKDIFTWPLQGTM
ncbi:hypothetical protein BV22DRAFT_1033489 [Leucogyrophana mollusca]|uniref:Uncharacterized protein n=1 Tax=Leucogyrophana mollusca TaxID=85980 RepID=A0ACB8BJI7_9AGAM|nr:hypothetical protein BV22DRAFT_1033489 [Leucogyrophana mollusca]